MIPRVPFRTCEETTVTPKELYFSLDRSVLRYFCVEKYRVRKSAYIVYIVRRRSTKKRFIGIAIVMSLIIMFKHRLV